MEIRQDKINQALTCLPFKPEKTMTDEIPQDIQKFIDLVFGGHNETTHAIWDPEYWENEFLLSTEGLEEYDQEKPPIMETLSKPLKYKFVWECFVDKIWTVSPWPPDLSLESMTELESSFLLASRSLYKQAFQMLRNFLEVTMASLFFIANPGEYKNWLAIKYDLPPFRKKNGDNLLEKLNNAGFLKPREREPLSDSYRDLNHSIHTTSSRLNWRFLQGKGPIFNLEDFGNWADYFSKIVEKVLRIYLVAPFRKSDLFQRQEGKA